MIGRIRRLAVGASVAAAITVPNLGWACDYSQFCGGYGNFPIDCATVIIGGTPVLYGTSGNVHEMSRPGKPDPTPQEQVACDQTVTALYGSDTQPRDIARDACYRLKDAAAHGHKPQWLGAEQVWYRL